jgi:hypothetical protein
MMRMKIRNIVSFAALVLFCFAFLLSPASATVTQLASDPDGSVSVTEVATENGDNYVRYPQLEGMSNLSVQQTINDEIVDLAKIAQRLITLSTLQATGATLQVGYTAYLHDQLFSVVISAKGMMENMRNGHAYTALAYDLKTGTRLQLSDFFTDADTATAWMEDQLLSGYADELSSYLEYAELTPLPADSFSFDENGITFWYPYKQFALLSGYSGAVQFQYGELQELLIAQDGSVPARLGALLAQYTDAQILKAIQTIAAEGTLPCVSVHLGDPIPDLIAQFRLVRTPDQYPGGRYFQLEAPEFRQVLVLSDALISTYDSSVVEGILATRMNLYGIQTGVTTRTRWQHILGEPTATVDLDSSIAADYGLPAGTADYYTVSDRQLMLYADTNGVLYAVRLTK